MNLKLFGAFEQGESEILLLVRNYIQFLVITYSGKESEFKNI